MCAHHIAAMATVGGATKHAVRHLLQRLWMWLAICGKVPVTVLLEVAGNVLPCEALRARPHLVQNLAGHRLFHTEPLHGHHKPVMQTPGPLNLHCRATCLTYMFRTT